MSNVKNGSVGKNEPPDQVVAWAPLASCVLAVASIPAWPLWPLSLGLAVVACLLGIVGLATMGCGGATARRVCGWVGAVAGGAVVVGWSAVLFLSWSAATGRPL